MFTARCVPDMYLFGTISAENAPEIAPVPAPVKGINAVGSQVGEWRPWRIR